MSLRINSVGTRLYGGNHAGHDKLPSMDRRRLGYPVFASKGFHAGLHHGARLHGPAEAGVRQARLQDHRAERRSGSAATARWSKDIEETQGYAVNYPMIGDPELEGGEALRHAARGSRRHVRGPDAGRQRHGALGLHHRTGQEDQGDADLPDDQRAQFRRGAAAPRLLPARRASIRSPPP